MGRIALGSASLLVGDHAYSILWFSACWEVAASPEIDDDSRRAGRLRRALP
jgi:hypothetical protein